MGPATSNQQSQQVAPAEMQSWANKNYAAVASVIRDHCRRDNVDNVQIIFPKGAKSGDEFRLDVSHKGEPVNSFVVSVSKDATGAESYQVKPLASADKETREQWGKEMSNYQSIPRTIQKEERIELAYNSTCVREGGFDPITRVSGPNDKASEVFYNGNTITKVSLSVQDVLKDGKMYTDAVDATSSKLDKLFNTTGNLNTSYVAEFPSDIKGNPVLMNLVSTLAGPKNAHNFAVVQENITNSNFLIPGRNLDDILSGQTTTYYLMPRYQADKDKDNSVPTASGVKTTNYIPQNAMRLTVTKDQGNQSMINFALNGKVIASQDRDKGGVPDDIIKINQGEYQIVPAVKVMSYHSEADGSLLGSAIAKFDGKTKLDVTNAFNGETKTIKPAEGSYRLFTAEVEGDNGKLETKVFAIQPIKDAKLPEGVVKEADYLTLDATNVFNQLDMKNAHLTVITVSPAMVSPESALKVQNNALQSYLSDIGGALKNILPTEANFNFDPSNRNFTSLKPAVLASIVTQDLRKTEFTISP